MCRVRDTWVSMGEMTDEPLKNEWELPHRGFMPCIDCQLRKQGHCFCFLLGLLVGILIAAMAVC